jgi:hypothetical protein
MRRLQGTIAFAVALAVGAGLLACGDLFHSTADFESACQIDPQACGLDGATADAGAPFPADFCQWDAATARALAARACAWLGACAGPLGSNAFGECLVNATLAFDCTANPNRPVLGATHAFWDHLWRASSCDGVTTAVEPASPRDTCGASGFPYVSCEVGANASTRIACPEGDGGTDLGREDCAALGQTCVVVGSGAVCAGSAGSCGDAGGPFCEGTELHDCDSDAGLDLGVDCADFGAGTCASEEACVALGDAGCPPTTEVSCSGDVASGCPSGVPEQVDCSQVLGATGSCNPAADGRGWDVSRACSVGPCGADSCAGTVLQSCARGAPVTLDCAQVGLGGCGLIQFPGDPNQYAACGPP